MNGSTLNAGEGTSANEIRSRPYPNCDVCGLSGQLLYANLTDRLFRAPGEWTVKRCPDLECGLIWLDPMPLEEDIGIAYRDYPTHDAKPNISARLSVFWRLADASKSAYIARRFKSDDRFATPLDWFLSIPIYLLPSHKVDLDTPISYLTTGGTGRLLESGCGSGSWLTLASDLGWDAEGIDFDRKAVEVARSKGCNVHVGQLTECSYPEGSFDLVLMNHVLEHVPDTVAVLREGRRVLRNNGRLLAWTPNSESWGTPSLGGTGLVCPLPSICFCLTVGF